MTITYSRTLSEKFMSDLQNGILHPLLDRIKKDQTLMLAIRENYINIYYRGGSLYKISQSGDGSSYLAAFDKNFNKINDPLPIAVPFSLNNDEQVRTLVEAIPELKYRMDVFYAETGKSEREFQQLVVRENNYSSDSHYFIVDIEVAGILPGARYDMLAVKWINRKQPKTLVPALIEMKYGIDTLDGVAGVAKHMEDAYALKERKEDWRHLLSGLETQLNQLNSLGLLKFKRSKNFERLEFAKDTTPELIFLFAGYNPGSKILMDILNAIDIVESRRNDFELLFFASSFAGYRMYRESMLNLEPFKSEVSRLFELASGTRRSKRELPPAENHN